MKPLIVLLVTFALLLAGTYFVTGQANYLLAGNGALAVMLVFTGLAHFAFTQGMMLMLPAWLPFRRGLVYATGVLEIAGGVGLLWPTTRPLAAASLLVFFAVVLPANVHAARTRLDYQKGELTGPGTGYLWFRVPLQLLFMAWAWYFGLHLPDLNTQS